MRAQLTNNDFINKHNGRMEMSEDLEISFFFLMFEDFFDFFRH